MAEKKKKNDYNSVMPYLILKDAGRFLDFTQKVFGAQDKATHMRDENLIMHGEIQIGESILMYADSTDEYAPQTAGLYIQVENADETYKKALAEGAVSVLEPRDMDYGRNGGVKDPCGNTWWIVSDK